MNTRIPSMLLVAAMSAILASGCKDDHSDHDHGDHDHAPAKPAAAEAEHDHDHDHAPGDAQDAEAHGDHDEHAHGDEEHADEVVLKPEDIKRWGIEVEPLSRHVLVEALTVPARVAFNAEATAHVGSVVSGRVSGVTARVGDEVQAGDVLLVVVSPELGQAQSAYLQSRGAIATSEAAVDVARSLHERAKALYDESRGIALSEVQKRQAELRSAEGALIAARTTLAAAENALHVLGMDQQSIGTLAESGEIDPRFEVRAPIAGRVIAREITLGEAVGPDRDALIVLADTTTLWVIADVPESRIGDVRIGSKSRISVAAIAEDPIEGEVAYLGEQLNVTTRTVPVRIELRSAGTKLRPGMFARAEIAAGDANADPVLAIPESAVQTVEGQLSVFVPVEGEANTFAKRVVRIGSAIGGTVPVLDGLKEGERYVARGSFILKADLGKAGAAHEH